jgi:hypothetical protein
MPFFCGFICIVTLSFGVPRFIKNKAIPICNFTFVSYSSSITSRGLLLSSNGSHLPKRYNSVGGIRLFHGQCLCWSANSNEPTFIDSNTSTLESSDSTTLKSASLYPQWITGFTDGEGCFSISAWKSQTTTGWKFKHTFTIALHKKDKAILELIKSYFGGQGEIYKQGKDSLQYLVASKKDLKLIIDHFNKYSLLTKKQADFELFKRAVEIMDRKEHLTLKGAQEIVALRDVMNKGLTSAKGAELKLALPFIDSIERPLIKDTETIDPNWVAGFVAAEGCFFVNIFKNSTNLGKTSRLVFKLTQHSRDVELMNRLMKFFGAGNIYKSRDTVYLHITKLEDINEKVMTFFEKYKIIGVKSKDYSDFKKVAELMNNKAHLKSEGLEEIQNIKIGMNKGRL